jgi:hypothetical protein
LISKVDDFGKAQGAMRVDQPYTRFFRVAEFKRAREQTDLTDSKFRKWVPTTLITGASPVVRWTDFGSQTLAEPFFNQSVQKITMTEHPTEQIETGLNELLEMADRMAPVVPSGLVFHISRCGSTLIANALRISANTIVISEAQPFSAALLPDFFRVELMNDASGNSTRAHTLRSLATIFGHSFQRGASKLVIKFTSWNILRISFLRSLWPTVPCIVVVRDPVEVMVSNLRSPSGWMQWKASLPSVLELFPWTYDEIAKMNAEEYCARVLGLFCQAGAQISDDHIRVVEYTSLDTKRIYEIAEFFNVLINKEHEGAITKILECNSKDLNSSPYLDDRAYKQRMATEIVRISAQKWANSNYNLLKQQATW